jgi:secreted trypsin-like serine protease
MKLLILVALCVAVATALPASPGLASGRIVGGIDATHGEVPYIVSLNWILAGRGSHVCGGSVLTRRMVLTAAHCRTELPNLGNVDIRAGITRLSQTDGQQIRVASWVLHPDYDGGVAPDDIGLIFLSAALTYNEHVAPIVLPEPFYVPHGDAVLSGWGQTNRLIPNTPDILQRAHIPVIPIERCQEVIGESPLTDRNVCTGPYTGGISACSGDSGGPVVQYDGQYPVQIGIVSWGFIPCGSVNAPSVHVKVAYYINWIKEYYTPDHNYD